MCPHQFSARCSSTHYEGEMFTGRIQSVHCILNNWNILPNHILEVSYPQIGKERAAQKSIIISQEMTEEHLGSKPSFR